MVPATKKYMHVPYFFTLVDSPIFLFVLVCKTTWVCWGWTRRKKIVFELQKRRREKRWRDCYDDDDDGNDEGILFFLIEMKKKEKRNKSFGWNKKRKKLKNIIFFLLFLLISYLYYIFSSCWYPFFSQFMFESFCLRKDKVFLWRKVH